MQTLSWIDWFVLGATLLAIVAYGTWKTRGSQNVKEYLRGLKMVDYCFIGNGNTS